MTNFVRTIYGRPEDLVLAPKDTINPLLYKLLSLCTPHKTEHHIVDIIRSRPYMKGLKKIHDPKMNNYIVYVGESRTLFSCHMDIVGDNGKHNTDIGKVDRIYLMTPENTKENSTKYGFLYGAKGYGEKDKIEEYSPSTLGADDKVGVYILLKMIEKGIPGMYVFHTGEELGGLGSSYLADHHKELFTDIDRAIAFDRANYGDVIGFQRNGRCCSTEFGKALASELNNGMPPKVRFKEDVHGSFTDTANYTKLIPECTNISVGYFNQHGSGEHLDNYWLDTWLLPAILEVNFETLPVKRDPKEVPKTYSYSHDYQKNYANIKKMEWKDATTTTPYNEFPVWKPELGFPEGASKEVLMISMARFIGTNNFGVDRNKFCTWIIDHLEARAALEEEVTALNAALAKATGIELPKPIVEVSVEDFIGPMQPLLLLAPPTVNMVFEEKLSLLTRLLVVADRVIVGGEQQRWLNNYTKGAKKVLEKASKKTNFDNKETAKVNRIIYGMSMLIDLASVLLPEEEAVLMAVEKHICENYNEDGWWNDVRGYNEIEEKNDTVH